MTTRLEAAELSITCLLSLIACANDHARVEGYRHRLEAAMRLWLTYRAEEHNDTTEISEDDMRQLLQEAVP